MVGRAPQPRQHLHAPWHSAGAFCVPGGQLRLGGIVLKLGNFEGIVKVCEIAQITIRHLWT